jgi:hypothetical protein
MLPSSPLTVPDVQISRILFCDERFPSSTSLSPFLDLS